MNKGVVAYIKEGCKPRLYTTNKAIQEEDLLTKLISATAIDSEANGRGRKVQEGEWCRKQGVLK